MSEKFNIFEDEKVQEIVWDKIIQDFSTSQMNIDNFCNPFQKLSWKKI